jgi:hypothetical protein
MIERHETVLAEYSDEYLREHRQRGDEQRAYADALLSAPPPEYRQGIEAAAYAMTYTSKSRPSRHDGRDLESYFEPTGVLFEDARQAALRQLSAQGVKLNPVPA